MRWIEWKSRMLLLALATASLMSACAATQTTTAQDLAWERWKRCDHFPDVRLNEIRPDGAMSITVKTAAIGGLQEAAAWKQCIDDAASVQAQRTARLSAERATPPIAPSVPVWRRGDEWTYRWAGPEGSGTDVWSMDREEVVDGIDCYVTRSGQREVFHRKTDLASVKETSGGEPAGRYSPPRLNYVWPLAIGKSWEQAFTEERRGGKQIRETRWSWEIEREESVTVPAGTFRTVKITIRDARSAAVVSESWYAPAARLPVRVVLYPPKGRSETELTRFRIE